MIGAQRDRWGALSVRNYRVYFLGTSVTLSGYWLLRAAQSWLVLDLTNSPAALGWLQVAQFAPITILTLFAGVVLDRVPMRKLMLVSQAVTAITAAITAVLVLSGSIRYWEVVVLGVVLGTASSFDQPARQAFANELVGPSRIGNAIALNSAMGNGARIVGPGIGGLLITAFGTGVCFAVACVSCIGAIISLLAVDMSLLYPKRQAGHGAVLGQLIDGVKYSFSSPSLGFQMVTMAFLGTFAFNWGLTLPLLARYAFNSGSDGFGALNAALGLGAVAGGLVLATRLMPTIKVVLIAATVYSVLVVLVGLAPGMPTALVVMLFAGAASISYSASANTLLQMEADDRYRGRVVALFTLLWAGSTPIGGGFTGWLSDRWSIRTAMEVDGVLCVIGVVVGALFLITARRRAALRAANV